MFTMNRTMPRMESDATAYDALERRWKLVMVLIVLIYAFLVHVLRFQRARSLERKYAPAGRESFRNMTADDAQAILKTLAELEFPSLYGLAMVVALFRVGGVQKYLCYSPLTEMNV